MVWFTIQWNSMTHIMKLQHSEKLRIEKQQLNQNSMKIQNASIQTGFYNYGPFRIQQLINSQIRFVNLEFYKRTGV